MTPPLSKAVYVVLVIGWYLIRYESARRSRREKIVSTARGPRENALLLTSLTGLGILPLIYVATAFPRFAAYTFHPVAAWLGLFVAVAALGMFQLTHQPASRGWSVLAPCILAASPGRANDVGNLWRQLSRVYGADRQFFPSIF
jgi:hypothetical protein